MSDAPRVGALRRDETPDVRPEGICVGGRLFPAEDAEEEDDDSDSDSDNDDHDDAAA